MGLCTHQEGGFNRSFKGIKKNLKSDKQMHLYSNVQKIKYKSDNP